MTGRRLSPAEQALWAKVMATVRPLAPAAARAKAPVEPVVAAAAPTEVSTRPRKGRVPPPPPLAKPASAPKSLAEGGLDRSWDQRIRRGTLAPDSSIDLHGHTLASAHAALDTGLANAIARGDRVLLLITGRPPGNDAARPYPRGAIRAAVHDWLAVSRHADRIAAVRQAHPRHGGAGALYLVLRRPTVAAPKF
ncbi:MULTISPECIES: Smr/MutS family protein [unclassified Sphingomonas]|uniref:Smr/MutS family protein n=1 Tax=unclassified Sphingomonas TaxID=196159 RepID=UPI00082D9E40|nr:MULTISPECIES: Smr/MutS family protein [unclassified Sphingomonas]